MRIFAYGYYLIPLFLGLTSSCVVVTSSSSGSCDSKGVRGNGQVATKNQTIDSPITSVSASTGLNIHISVKPNSSSQLRIQAESNLFDRIHSDVSGDAKTGFHLRLYASHLCSTKPIDIFLTIPQLTQLEATSGSQVEVQGTNQLHQVTASSGSQINVSSIETSKLEAEASSGAQITLKGQAETIQASASSGAQVDAKSLKTSSGIMESSSGAQIHICANRTVQVAESSGGEAKNHCR